MKAIRHKSKKRQTKKPRTFHCPLCTTPVMRRGDLCHSHELDLRVGKEMRGAGIDIRQHTETIPDMNCLAAAMIVFAPLTKINAPYMTIPQAISVRGTWFAQIDANHPLHRHYEAEFERLK